MSFSRSVVSTWVLFLMLQTGTIAAAEFVVFDATGYAGGRPDMLIAGVGRMPIVYEAQMDPEWSKVSSPTNLPQKLLSSRAINSISRGYAVACLDVEAWPLTPEMAPSSFGDTIAKMQTILQWAHEAAPGVKFGFYGVPPLSSYWGPVALDSDVGKWWTGGSKALASLAAKADIIFPSLYTFYTDQDQWEVFAVRQIEAARQYGKPVYVFLWPQYHDSNRFLGLHFIPRDYWKRQLRVAHEHADGIVIWGGWDPVKNRPMQWDSKAPWWLETKDFMASLHANTASKAPTLKP